MDDKEQAILRWAVQNGKSKEEATQAIIRYRTTGSPADPSKPLTTEPPKQDFLGDIGEMAGAGVQRIAQGFEQAKMGEGKTPIDALESGIKVGEGAVQVATSPLAPLIKPLQDMIGFISGKIAEVPGVQKFADSEAGKVTERVAEDIAGLSTIAGAVTGVKTTPVIGRALSNVAKSTQTALQGITETGASGIKKATEATLDPAAIMQRVARISKGKQADFQRRAGESVGEYLVKRGIFGDVDEITTQLFQRFQKSRDTADNAFAKLDERTGNAMYKPEPVGTALDELFAREQRVATPGARSKDFTRIAELKRKFQTQGLNHTEINEVKRLYERNVRVDYLKENKPEAVAKATNLDTAIREWQRAEAENMGLTNLAEINRETFLAKQLVDDLGREYFGQQGNNAITLTDWILVSNLDPTAISALLVKKGLSDKGVQSAIAKKLAGSPEQPDIYPVFENTGQIIDSYGKWIKKIESQPTTFPKVRTTNQKIRPTIPEELKSLSDEALRNESMGDFVSNRIFGRSLSPIEKRALGILKDEDVSDALVDFYKKVRGVE